jgi:hypothetical protein
VIRAGRTLVRLGVAGAFVLAVAGYPVLTLAIAGLLALLVKLETRS